MARLVVLFAIAFVDTVGAAMVVPLLPFYGQRYGASAFLVGFLVSAFSIVQLVSAPAWGRLSDRMGRRPVLLAGLVVSALAYVVFAFADSVWLLLLSRLVQGLGGGTIGVVQAYVADASPPEQRTRSIGWLTTVTSLGWLSGSGIGSLLVLIGGARAPGLFTAGLSLVVALVAFGYLSESKDMYISATHAVPAQKPRSGLQAIRHVISHWHEPAPRLIWIYAICIGAFYGTAAVMPLLVQERLGVTERTIGYIVMYLAGIGVVVRAGILGRMVKWLKEVKLARLGIVLLAAGLALAAFGHGYLALFTAFTLMPFGTAFLFPSVTGLLSKIVSRAERGVYLGVQQTFGGVGRVAFPLFAGIMMDRFGRGTPFWIAAILAAATLPLTAKIGDHS
ncbi:MAG TPA: MFS transporter [Gemmatimonadales bacterium]|nr:MFS transporter [Gemmatimonadales bacterium]